MIHILHAVPAKAQREQRLQAALVALRDALGDAGSPWMLSRGTTHRRGVSCIAMDLEPVIEPIAIDKLVPALARHRIELGPTRRFTATGPPVLRATHTPTGVTFELCLKDKLSGQIRRHLVSSFGPNWLAEFRRAVRARERAG